jgi:hypothetical protein
MKRAGWMLRRFVWSPVRTLFEVIAGIFFYGYAALSLAFSGAELASEDRAESKLGRAGWFSFELVRYGVLSLLVWLLGSVYFTIFEREIFLSAWRDTYRPWFRRKTKPA